MKFISAPFVSEAVVTWAMILFAYLALKSIDFKFNLSPGILATDNFIVDLVHHVVAKLVLY